MIKILASLEDLQQTKKLHSSLLQSISRQLNTAGRFVATELREGMQFPIETGYDLMSMEDKVLDTSTIKALVSHFTV